MLRRGTLRSLVRFATFDARTTNLEESCFYQADALMQKSFPAGRVHSLRLHHTRLRALSIK